MMATRVLNPFVLFAFALVLLLGALAHAQDVPPVPDIPIAVVLARIVADVTLHKWLALFGTIVVTILGIAATHKVGLTRVLAGGFFATDAGGVVWSFLISTLSSLAVSWSAGQVTTRVILLGALGIGITSIGGYTGLRKLLGPTGLGAKLPWVAKVADWIGPVTPAVVAAKT